MPTESPRESAYSTYHEEQVNPVPVYEVPITESIAEPFLPYRGTQMHGVDPGQMQFTLDEDVEGGKVPTSNFEQPEADVNPVPVRIVGAATTEYKQFRCYHVAVTDTPVMVVGQKLGRSLVEITTGAFGGTGPPAHTFYVGPDSNVRPENGYPVNSGDSFASASEAPIWAVCNNQETTHVAVHTEFATPQ